MTDLTSFTAAMEQAENQPDAVFTALQKLVQDTIGAKLFTLMTFDWDTQSAQRIYSNMPDAYPISGKKGLDSSDWSLQVLKDKKCFVANSIADIAEVFNDHELIASLGCESCINIPIVVAGTVKGTMNCLDVAGHYTPDRVALAETLKTSGALAFLIHEKETLDV